MGLLQHVSAYAPILVSCVDTMILLHVILGRIIPGVRGNSSRTRRYQISGDG